MDLRKIYETYMKKQGDQQEEMYKYYSNDESVIAVFKREIQKGLTDEGNINNNEAMHINFMEDIIQRKTGYMASNISIKTEDDTLAESIKVFEKQTKQDTNNMDSIANASVSGISHRLVYTDNGEVKIKNILPWQVVYDYTEDIFNPDYAYYFYSLTDMEGHIVYHCDIYGKTDVAYYIKYTTTSGTQDWRLDDTQSHNFNQVPIFPFINNTAQIGDCENVINIMNNYDIVLSDTADELKATRLTYLKIWGDLYTGQDSDGEDIPLVDWLTRGRAMIFGPDEDGKHTGDAQFLSKVVDDEAVQSMLKLLRTHIYEGSGSVDLKELSDNADARVFSIQAALSRLENNANVTENYARIALTKQYELLLFFMGETGQGVYSVDDIDIIFTRNFVKDDAALVTMLQTAMNVMSTEDAYALSDLFDNPKEAAERYEEGNAFTNPPEEVVVIEEE